MAITWKVEMPQDPTEGRKFDQGKPDFTLLPWDAVEQVVRVLDYGAKKYARDNWRYVDDAQNRYMAAVFRHLSTYMQGEEQDPETGINHLAHACCSLLFVLALTGDDDGDNA